MRYLILVLIAIVASVDVQANDSVIADKCTFKFEYTNNLSYPLYMIDGREMMAGAAFYASGTLQKPKSTSLFTINEVAAGGALPTEIDDTTGTELKWQDGAKTFVVRVDHLKTVQFSQTVLWPMIYLTKMTTAKDATYGERTSGVGTDFIIRPVYPNTPDLSISELEAIHGNLITTYKNPNYAPPIYQWQKVNMSSDVTYKDLGGGKSQTIELLPDGSSIPVETVTTAKLPNGQTSTTTTSDPRLYPENINCWGQTFDPNACSKGYPLDTDVKTVSGGGSCVSTPTTMAQADLAAPAELVALVREFATSHLAALKAKQDLAVCHSSCQTFQQKYMVADQAREQAWNKLTSVDSSKFVVPADVLALQKAGAYARPNLLHQDNVVCFVPGLPETPQNISTCLISRPSQEQWDAAVRTGSRANYFNGILW